MEQQTTQLTRIGADKRWLEVLSEGLGHKCWTVKTAAKDGGQAELPLALVQSALFGRFLVSLPYINTASANTTEPQLVMRLVDKAIAAADHYRAKFLELRSEFTIDHPQLVTRSDAKVHMRLPLPTSPDTLWKSLDPKVRNQVRKGERSGLSVHWGSNELLDEFYQVFSINMRDLGTPVFSKRLFQAILLHFEQDAELCVVRLDKKPVAAGLLVHGPGFTEVPSASSLRRYNSTNANMLMYWHLLERAIARRSSYFDFGRSSPDSGTYRFKKQWGALPCPAVWQYYLREGSINDMRPDNARFSLAIRVWRKLPVWLTRLLGPVIVRGIP
ncbi:MAG: hypothetical protein KatS3mg110_2988 [Pirellulaceae bacterium]|nr:MAG: hypothetical protein KatS3mg110_2988 [Pirellulaceae bacterium]